MRSEVRVEREGFTTGSSDPDGHMLVLQHLLERLPNAGLVVHDEDPIFHARGTPISVAPLGWMWISRIPAGILTGTVFLVGSPSAFEIRSGSAWRGMGNPRTRKLWSAHSAWRGPTTVNGPAASIGS